MGLDRDSVALRHQKSHRSSGLKRSIAIIADLECTRQGMFSYLALVNTWQKRLIAIRRIFTNIFKRNKKSTNLLGIPV